MQKEIIKREKYFSQIENFIWKSLVKVFVWLRRVWKSYFLLQIIDYLKQNWVSEQSIVYVNKENLKFDFIKTYEDLYDFVKNYNHIFVDEVQEIKDWEKAIRSLIAEWKDVYITGSNSNLLSGELATFLSGRYVSFHIYPLDYKEFLQFHNLKSEKESFYKYLRYGGLPYLRNLNLNDDVYVYLKDVVNTVVFKDVISRYKIRNIDFYEKLLIFLAKNIGNILSAKNIADFLKSQQIKVWVASVLEYLKYTQNAFLIDELKRYDLKWKRFFELKHKFFFEDIWIRNAIVWWFDSMDISWLLENLVYINLVSNWWKVYVWEYKNYEIDFVCEKWNDKMFIQVAYLLETEQTKQREFRPLLELNNSYPKFVLSLDDIAWWNIEGVKHVNLVDFLLEL